MEKKNNKGLIWVIIILIVLVLGLAGFIVYDKILLSSKKLESDNTIITTTTTAIQNEKEINVEDYIGKWYINQEHAKATIHQNPTTLDIVKENDYYNLSLYITRIGDFSIELNDDIKTFIGTSENARTESGEASTIEGNISFEENNIKLNIVKSDALYLEDNQDYNFTISLSPVSGEELDLEYNENFFTLQNSEIRLYKETETKISKAKIFNSPLSSDVSESAFIIMENGDVYLSYFGAMTNELIFIKYENFKDYKIEDIISCDENFEQKCEVILKDGSKITI